MKAFSSPPTASIDWAISTAERVGVDLNSRCSRKCAAPATLGPSSREPTLTHTPTDAEWDEFLGHFERRKLALGDCGRAYGTSCQHEHSCIRCPVLRVDPAQRSRLETIRDNLSDRVAEAEEAGWLGEADGLRTSLAAAEEKLAELDHRARQQATVFLATPSLPEMTARTAADLRSEEFALGRSREFTLRP